MVKFRVIGRNIFNFLERSKNWFCVFFDLFSGIWCGDEELRIGDF